MHESHEYINKQRIVKAIKDFSESGAKDFRLVKNDEQTSKFTVNHQYHLGYTKNDVDEVFKFWNYPMEIENGSEMIVDFINYKISIM